MPPSRTYRRSAKAAGFGSAAETGLVIYGAATSNMTAAITIDPWEDLKRELKYWRKRGVFDRILIATRNSIALFDIVGREKYDLNYWIKAASAQEI